MGLIKDLNIKVKEHDFKRSFSVKATEAEKLYSLYTELIQEIGKFWGERFEASCEVTGEDFKYLNFGDYLGGLASPLALAYLELHPLAGGLIWDIPPNFSFFIIESLLGAKEEEVVVLERDLSPLEQEFLKDAIEEIIPLFSNFFSKRRLCDQVKFSSIFFSLDDCKILPLEEQLISFPWDLKLKEMNFSFSFNLPSISWERLRKALMLEEKKEKAEEKTIYKEMMEKHIGKTRLKIKVLLGTAGLSVKEFLSLQKGDVIRLRGKVEDKLVLFIEEKPYFLCLPGMANNDKLGVRIDSLIKER
jgi:flagellar motor switch protein FliM